jgi:uncharacterized protein YbjT (DUF2867 family)
VGDQSDAAFLTKAFAGADAVYALIPPKMDVPDVRAYYGVMTAALVTAIRDARVKKVVLLSSLGAERESGTGPVLGLHDTEKTLDALKEVDMIFLRAGYFYENLLTQAGLIKSGGMIAGTADPDAPILMVAAQDIGHQAAALLAKRNFKGHTIMDLFGQQLSYRQAALTIGKKIGIPKLSYVQSGDDDAITSMAAMGMSRNMAASLVELSHAISRGEVTSTKIKSKSPNAQTKFAGFVSKTFYPAYKAVL